MDTQSTVQCADPAYWPMVLAYVLPPTSALLSATALWVASRARSSSKDAQTTSAALAAASQTHDGPVWHRRLGT